MSPDLVDRAGCKNADAQGFKLRSSPNPTEKPLAMSSIVRHPSLIPRSWESSKKT